MDFTWKRLLKKLLMSQNITLQMIEAFSILKELL